MLKWVSASRLFTLARQGRRLTPVTAAVILATLFLVASQFIGGVPVYLVLWALVPGGSTSLADQPLPLGLGAGALLAGVTLPVFGLLWAWLRWFERRPFYTLGFEGAGALGKYARGFLVGGLLFAASLGLSAAFGYVTVRPAGPALGLATIGGVLAILLGWLVQGASEEALTRGWLLGSLGARYRPWLGVFISSLTFAALHGLNPNLSGLALLNLFLFGLFAALYALREGGLWGVCAEHSAWNWLQGNVFGLEVSGMTRSGPILLDLRAEGPDLITGGAFGPEGGLAVTAVLVIAILALAFWPRRALPSEQLPEV